MNKLIVMPEVTQLSPQLGSYILLSGEVWLF